MQFKGKIRVVSEHKGIEKVLVDVENTITELFEEVVAAGSIDFMYGMNSAIEGGQTYLGIQNPDINGGIYYNKPNYFITVYFLNLGSAELQALTKKSHTLPIYAGDYTLDESKIVGFATSTYTATKSKQGYLDPLKGENLIKYRRHGLRFKWDANILSGTYNCIAVGLRTDVDRFSGISMYRGVETANPILGEAVASGYWLRPGVKNSDGSKVYTADNEILLGDGTSTTKARKVLNLETGVETLLESSDFRYDFPLIHAQEVQLVSGNTLIYSKSNGCQIYEKNLDTLVEDDIYTSGYGAFIYEGYLYMRASTSNFRAYSLPNFTYTSSKNITFESLQLPEGFCEDYSDLYITSIGGNFLVQNISSFSTSGVRNNRALLCSDILNVKGSIIDVIPNLYGLTGFYIGSTPYFFAGETPVPYNTSKTFYYTDTSGSQKSITKGGLRFCCEGMYGNMLSFHTFEEPQQIPTGNALKLDYYYTFEQ